MTYNLQFDYIKEAILVKKDVKVAIDFIREMGNDCPQTVFDGRLDRIEEDYRRMKDFVLSGFPDEERPKLYMQLLRQLFALGQEMQLEYCLQRNTSYMTAALKCREIATLTHEEMSERLETFVQEVALLSLDPNEEKKQALYAQHFDWLAQLFDAVLVSKQWSESHFRSFATLLTSPTIDVLDARLLTSAVMLACVNIFDVQKFHLLVHLAITATDLVLRARALVGVAFALNNKYSLESIYPELKEWIQALTDDEARCAELLELQMQVIYCMNTEKDMQVIQNEIMPGIVKNQNLAMNTGIFKGNETDMDDILHPENTDRRMQEMEENMKRMIEMQKRGSDIFFSGFSQMKRFGFFHVLSNWFIPYTENHPELEHVRQKLKGQPGVLSKLAHNSPFCDSDIYSFQLALSSVIDNLPQNIQEMLRNGAAMIGMEGMMADPHTNSNERLRYLQNLYRFYNLYLHKNEFDNPFDYSADTARFFFINSLFDGTTLRNMTIQVATLLAKRNEKTLMGLVLDKAIECGQKDERLMALWAIQKGDTAKAIECYRRILDENNDDMRAWRKVALLSSKLNRHEDVFHACEELLRLQPDSIEYATWYGMSAILTGRTDEAVKKLYETDFNHPENMEVERVLAWGLLLQGKPDKAEGIAEKAIHRLASESMTDEQKAAPHTAVKSNDGQEYEAWLIAGYAFWAQGRIQDAVERLKEFKNLSGKSLNTLFDRMEEQMFFDHYAINFIDRNIMQDLTEDSVEQ